jgi:hypothetical protein
MLVVCTLGADRISVTASLAGRCGVIVELELRRVSEHVRTYYHRPIYRT